MKKKLVIIISVLILVGIISFTAYSNYVKTREALTGETVTGEATDSNFAVSVSVIVETPSVTLIYPENETYITAQNLWLNYTSGFTSAVWYKLDSNPNITLTGNTIFNTTEGVHTLYLYGNNTGGTNVSDNVTFTVNSSKFRVLYDEYAGSTKGGSIDFNKSSYEDLQDLSGIVLENTEWGKIQFYAGINVTNDEDASDNEADLDTHTNISENRIEINSTALPNFNTSATLYLYNLTLDDPRILRDGSVCSDSICTEIDYTAEKTLIFNVTQFTVYSADETPAEAAPAPSPGGGGVSAKKSFTIDKETLSVSLKQGETILRSIIITNNGNQKLSISIENPELKDFLKISEESFELNAGESKSVVFDILVGEETIPDLYIGKLIVKGDGIEKEILIAIEVESKKALFDVKVEIPKRFMYIMPGEEMSAKIEIFNLGDVEKVDALIEYIIMNEEGNKIISEQEMKTIETSISFVKKFKIPENVKSGRYVLYVKVIYEEQIGSASAWFNVIIRISFISFILRNLAAIIISILVIIIILFVIIYKRKERRKEKRKGSFMDYKKRLKKGLERHKK